MVARASIRRGVFAAVLFAALASWAGRPACAGEDHERPKLLIYAAYDDETAAFDAFKALLAAEQSGAIKLESYAVVAKGFDGRVKVKDQRQTRAKTGAIVGALVGVLGGPVAVAVGTAAGGAAGYLSGNAVGMSKTFIATIKSSLQLGECAIIAVVDERHAEATESLQGTKAVRVMSYTLSANARPAASR